MLQNKEDGEVLIKEFYSIMAKTVASSSDQNEFGEIAEAKIEEWMQVRFPALGESVAKMTAIMSVRWNLFVSTETSAKHSSDLIARFTAILIASLLEANDQTITLKK